MKKHILMTTMATLAITVAAQSIHAETTTTTTIVQSQPAGDNTMKVNLMAFDSNHDNILSMREVGEKLFDLFDQDHNGYIDNIEFNKKMFITVIPMEKDTIKFVDYDDDGKPDAVTHTTETFMADSHLKRFDTNGDGLTPAEFIQTGYQKLDIDNDQMISKDEWKKAYHDSVYADINEPGIYNK